MSEIRTAVMFDMRAPSFGAPARDLYEAALDIAAFADEMGVTRINLMEHHASEDGYLPRPFVMGGGVAARTKNARLSLGAVILPLHDPVAVAEEIAVLDLMSNGRLEVTFGAGYVASEFAAFNASLSDRAKKMDQGLDTILRALHGERFSVDGRPVYVRPLPLQKPEDILLVGGGVEASAKRAARFGLGFSPLRADLFPLYDAECRRHGREPGRKYGGGSGPISIHLSLDPERAWRQILPSVKHVVSEYARWAEDEKVSNSPFAHLATDETALKASGIFQVWTPEELLECAPKIVGEHGGLSFWPLIGGLSPTLAWESMELLKSVMPRLQAAKRVEA
jgi:alkanesulfonate monooxygenase SsuD/methylene tetrahydromethanopterin reductase-like flavin-dependent oxidoreductase (luciferase family)